MDSVWLIYYIALYLCIILPMLRSKQATTVHRLRRKRKNGGKIDMHEIINRFLNKECIIYTMNSQQIEGVITAVNEG